MHFEGGAQPEGLLCAERQRPASGCEPVTNKGSCRRHEPRVKRGMTSRAGLAVAVLVATSIGLAEGFSGNLGFSLGRSRGISLVSKQGMASGLPQKAAVGCSLWAGGFGAKKAARAAGCSIVQLSSSTASFLDLEDDERKDYREADIMGYRLFVTGLAPTVDDVRLYLAFQNCGKVVEAHVAKPGLGYVLFEDLESASNAVDTMDNECVGGKEVRVKRARGFYIRMEAEARRKAAQKQRDREMLGAVVQHEIASRLKVAEEEHFASLDHKVGGHMRTFDVVTTKREILRDITQEALNTQQPRRRASSPEEFKKMMGQERQNFDQVRGQIEDETEAYQAKASMIEDEERIRKQAMMEIMVEGDKLSKAARGQSNDKTINMARLIRERMDQIKRYEMLRENRELLGNITFTAAATPNSRTLVTDEKLAKEENEIDEDEDEDGVTDAERALIRTIDENEKARLGMRRGGRRDEDAGDAIEASGDNVRGRTAIREKAPYPDLSGILHMDDAEFERIYAPAKGPKGRGFSVQAETTAKAKKPAAKKTAKKTVEKSGVVEGDGKAKRRRGRPPLTEAQKKPPAAYVPTGRPRGRPRKVV